MIERYEAALKQKVRRIEVDKGGEFMGVVLEMLGKKKIRVIQKQTNAVVEQVNAKMQRIFWNLVEQRRGAFIPTAKQAVKISNRTYNRRIGMNPEEALEKIAAGENISQRTPKAGPTERKKAWKVGENVRALIEGRTKGDTVGYKAYKGAHYGAPLLRKLNTQAYIRNTKWVANGNGETKLYARDPWTRNLTTLS